MKKERGLPFQPDMALAAYEDRKTNTRRIIQSRSSAHPCFVLLDHGDGWWPYYSDDGESSITSDGNETPMDCPYGMPGDRLWVREPWRTYASLDHLPPRSIASGAGIQYEAGGTSLDGNYKQRLLGIGKYRHGRFMCRWMSRTLLEVVSVRVERLQDISEEDAKTEGIPFYNGYWRAGVHPEVGGYQCWATAKRAFQALWDSINAERAPWSSNPWVWAVEFKRVAA